MEFVAGNVFVRDCSSPHEPGWTMEGHVHNFDHVTMIHAGRYRCKRWGQAVDNAGNPIIGADGVPAKVLLSDVEVTAPHWFLVKSHEYHAFECLEGPGILWCIYSHRDPQTGEVVQKWNGWGEAVS